MKIAVVVAAVVALLAGPAFGQDKHVPRYGEVEKDKSTIEKASEKEAERAYQRSLNNIPEQKSTDPWGIVRSDNAAPKAAAKTAPAKPKAKTDANAAAKTDGAVK